MTPAGRQPWGVLLAGGRGSRLDGTKPLVDLGGRPLFMHGAQAMVTAGLRVALVAKPASGLAVFAGAGDPPIEVIEEPEQPVHPLLGVVTALERLGEPVVVCACDMPFVPPELFAWLAEVDGYDAVVGSAGGFLQTLLARYEPVLIDRLRAAVEAGKSARSVVEELGARALVVSEEELARFGPVERALLDVDTPDDLARARSLLGEDDDG
jgi:molybdopterin-guanine dinucleotide biosynthesis protein A